MRFIIVAIIQIGVAWLIVMDTGSLYLGLVLMAMMIVQYDQIRRNHAMSVVMRRLWTDARDGKKGVSL